MNLAQAHTRIDSSVDALRRGADPGEGVHEPRFSTLPEWLKWQQQLHAMEIELGLDRLRAVSSAMGLARPAPQVVTVAGTNGKGSSVAMLEAILTAAGYRVGSYTSPHLKRYNERVKICGDPVDDALLCRAFERIDWARDGISLTFFEFGTLAALWTFARYELDVVILEVGLGGRLDAVNLVDADAVLIASIGIDHQEWLGADRETIALEKAGVLRPDQAAIIADPSPPRSLLERSRAVGARAFIREVNFGFRERRRRWDWWGGSRSRSGLPKPGLAGRHQLDNASGVLALLELGGLPFSVSDDALRSGLTAVELPGRFQRIPGPVERIYDVAHNSDGARSLALNLAAMPPSGRSFGVVGMLKDKPAAEMFSILAPQIDRWYLGGLDGSRGLQARELRRALDDAGVRAPAALYDSVVCAERAASQHARNGDRIVCFGSFRTVAACVDSAG